MTNAVYAGSFDPPTKSHEWVIYKGAELFNNMTVAVGVDPQKRPAFSVEERVDMLRKITRDINGINVGSYENTRLVDYAGEAGAKYILRGLREDEDFLNESPSTSGLCLALNRLNLVFLMPPPDVAEISSSTVKGLVGPKGWENVIEPYLHRHVYQKMLQRFGGYAERFGTAWQSIGTNDDPGRAYKMVADLYSNPKREYHNLVHIAHSLQELDGVRDLAQNPRNVEMALWFHDAVYEELGKFNEEGSAGLARRTLKNAGVPRHCIDDISRLVLATKHDKPYRDNDARLIMDIDLASLGKPWQQFNDYGDDIRHEYPSIDDAKFIMGRKAFFWQMLERQNIYSTPFFREKYERQARKNMSAWIEGNEGRFLEE